jgi:hypothetical protein
VIIDATKKLEFHQYEAEAYYNFKCTLRTQDLRLESVVIKYGSNVIELKQKQDKYQISINGNVEKAKFLLESAFTFEPDIASFTPDEYHKYQPLFAVQRSILHQLKNTRYLGPFRQSPQRSYPTRGASPAEVGPLGESTITLLANEIIQKQSREHIEKIQEWLSYLKLANKLDVKRISGSEQFGVNITLADGKSFPLADLGYGLSQVLPVLAQCSFAPEGATLLFEQPEIHLHSIAARGLAKVFIDTVKEKKARIVIETHSPDLIHQLQRELRSKKLSVNDLALYKVTRKNEQTNFKLIEIDSDDFDIYENWEDGLTR